MDRKPCVGDVYDPGLTNRYWKIISIYPFKAHWVDKDTLVTINHSDIPFSAMIGSKPKYIGNFSKSNNFKIIYDILNG